MNRLTHIIQAQQRGMAQRRGQEQGVRRELERQVRLEVLDFRQFTASRDDANGVNIFGSSGRQFPLEFV